MKSFVRAALRLWTDTGTSRLAMLRARFAPITARPVTPIWLSSLMGATITAERGLRQSFVMHVAELWRYPVKSMAGERLGLAYLGTGGVHGDRTVHVQGPRGLLTARTTPRLLGLHGTLDPDGNARVDGHRWDSPGARAAVRVAAGPDAAPLYYDGPRRFDVLPLLVATDGAIAAFGRDRRRLRPNVVVAGVSGLAERGWEWSLLAAGEAVIALADLRGRCIATTWDPDTLEQDVGVLRGLRARFDGALALNAWAARDGEVAVGDAVHAVQERIELPVPEPGRFAA